MQKVKKVMPLIVVSGIVFGVMFWFSLKHYGFEGGFYPETSAPMQGRVLEENGLEKRMVKI